MRSAQQVAKRAIVMTTLAFRASLEVTDHSRSEEISGRLLNWLQRHAIADELDLIEREILEAPYRKMHQSQLTDATLAGEGACLFAWAIGLGDPLPKRESADARGLVQSLHILQEDVRELIDGASLKPEDELTSCCLEIFLTLSNMRQRRLSDVAAQAIIRNADANRMAAHGLLPTDVACSRSNEFVDSLSEEQRRAAAGFYFVRSVAASWLLDNRQSFFQ